MERCFHVDGRANTMRNPPGSGLERRRSFRTSLILSSQGAIAIVDVILGPGSDENSVFAAQRFLKSEGLDLSALSKVPYRAHKILVKLTTGLADSW